MDAENGQGEDGEEVGGVLFTSSVASVVDLTQDKRFGCVFTADDWDPVSYAERSQWIHRV
ncbi:hypothetical protein K432DRAFT_386415 [Lepidopterella palustris CBS 459.81]|uniref:Uncharacterized protein n=1 Tax=Lepidopterella palustris CBS 459.81 TaxID=1314670 RepID=A0A8E2E0E1_9PEZI|nr:hypothetical protein K432DRAFT_386415 [Lepidopterella palustris CBS 459.81]